VEIFLGHKHGLTAANNSRFGHGHNHFHLRKGFLGRSQVQGLAILRRSPCGLLGLWKEVVGNGSERHDFQWIVGADIGVNVLNARLAAMLAGWCREVLVAHGFG